MRKLLFAFALLPAVTLGGCAGGYGYGGVGYADAGPIGYDGYYDDYYGPIHDGYWGTDGAFYYRGGDRERRFRRGDPSHFMRGQGPGPGGRFHAMQGSFTPGRGMHTPRFGGATGMRGPGGGGRGHH